MGFDLSVHIKLTMCPETGKPFYYGPDFEKVYTIPDMTIPEHLRSYLQGRGRHFFAYIERFPESCEVDVEQFLDDYPKWEEVAKHDSYDESWTKDDHERFIELLFHLLENQFPFSVSWSY